MMTRNEYKTAKIAIALYEAAKKGIYDAEGKMIFYNAVDAEAYESAMRMLAFIDIEKSDIDIKCPYYPCKETNNE